MSRECSSASLKSQGLSVPSVPSVSPAASCEDGASPGTAGHTPALRLRVSSKASHCMILTAVQPALAWSQEPAAAGLETAASLSLLSMWRLALIEYVFCTQLNIISLFWKDFFPFYLCHLVVLKSSTFRCWSFIFSVPPPSHPTAESCGERTVFADMLTSFVPSPVSTRW